MNEINKNKILVIINPRAGKFKTKRQLFDIAHLLSKDGREITVYTTACRNDATRIARDLSEPYDIIVCRGGDGTLNEVINGLMKAPVRKPIGYVPSGSTNDFAKSLGIESNAKKSVEQILNGSLHPHDLGLFNDERHFTYVSCFGAFVNASYRTSQIKKNLVGHAAYMAEAAKLFKDIHKIHAKVIIDDDEVIEDDFAYGSVCNTLSLASVVKIDKGLVDFHDGKFEVILVKCPKNLKEFNTIAKCMLTQNYDENYVYFRQASNVKFEFEHSTPWSLDGEFGGDVEKVEIKNIKEAIEILR